MSEEPLKPYSLRADAEIPLASKQITKAAARPAEELLHELQVHQIELEMQNETLRQAQITLEESRDRYLNLYEFAPIGYLTLTDSGLITELNLKATILLGVERKKLLRRGFVRLVASEDRDRWHHFFSGLLKGSGKPDLDLVLQRGDGARFDARLDCVRAEGGSSSSVRIALTDISERKLAEKELRIAAIAFESQEGMMVTNPNGVIVRVNRAFTRLTGYSAEEAIGNTPAMLHSGHQDKAFYQRMWDTLKQKRYWQGEIWNRRKDGDIYIEWIAISAAMSPDGSVSHYIGAFFDVSELKSLENEVTESRQLLRNLAEKTELMREEERKHIAREVHDELGQILTALRMDVALINLRFGERDAALLEKTQDMTGLLDRASQSVRNIVSNLRPTVLDMGIVPAVGWLCNDFATRTGTSCVLHAVEERVDLDEVRAVAVFRMVQELLTNAARHARASSVKISLARHGNNLKVEVRDNGKGFDPAAMARNQSFGLLGMRERAMALGGTVEVVSAPNQGTVATIIVPAKPAAGQRERRKS